MASVTEAKHEHGLEDEEKMDSEEGGNASNGHGVDVVTEDLT